MLTNNTITIGGREVGPHAPPYLIAEISANHNGDIGRALALIDAAKAAGADAVKLQTYTKDTMTIDHDGPGFVIHGGLWDGKKLYDLYEWAHTPWDWHERLFQHADDVGIQIFSTPFDLTAVDFLRQFDPPAYKIASFEVVDIPLLRAVAAQNKPVIVSTGMTTRAEVADAVRTLREHGCPQIILLHCVSGYPTDPKDSHLRTIPDLQQSFDCAIGLSDHTLGTAVSVGSIALGAVMIEKHFIQRRADGGPDSAFSLEPEEFAALVRDCRTAWNALGYPRQTPLPEEMAMRELRRSLYVVEDIAAGEVLTAQNVRAIRPGYGLPPKELDNVLGRRAARAIARGTPLSHELLA
ncbi:MAG: pseudaminic acid synthase [Alphaproteobacteria bacterium]|nr:pseudaminic acid synthase [Alphaproteobacteria bacterium]